MSLLNSAIKLGLTHARSPEVNNGGRSGLGMSCAACFTVSTRQDVQLKAMHYRAHASVVIDQHAGTASCGYNMSEWSIAESDTHAALPQATQALSKNTSIFSAVSHAEHCQPCSATYRDECMPLDLGPTFPCQS